MTTKQQRIQFLLKSFAARAWATAPQQVLAFLAGTVLLISYTTVFWITGAATPSGAVLRALINTVPAGALAVLSYQIVLQQVVRRPIVAQATAHILLSLSFSLAWYLGIVVIYGLQSNWLREGLLPRAFSGVAFTWQMFQGVTVYAVVATYTYAVRFWQETRSLKEQLVEARSDEASPDASRKLTQRLLLRRDREIVPVDAKDIIRISGAGDRAEVFTRTGMIPTSSTLTELEAALPEGFLRVHRSHLVSLAAVLHAEPAGNGRLTLHLPDGNSVTASRAGARAFRESVL